MLSLFRTLRFEEKLMNAFDANNKFKQKWIDALHEDNNDIAIINIFKQFNYPISS